MTTITLEQTPSPIPANPSFDDLARSYSRDLIRYASWLCGDRPTAEDLVQETLIRAWRSLDKLQNPKAAKAWLLTILRRENARRFERVQPLWSEVAPDEIRSTTRTYDTSAEAFVLRRAIRELPKEYREPLLLQVIDGYSQEEIAERIGISAAGVGTRLFRARQRLRAAFGESS